MQAESRRRDIEFSLGSMVGWTFFFCAQERKCCSQLLTAYDLEIKQNVTSGEVAHMVHHTYHLSTLRAKPLSDVTLAKAKLNKYVCHPHYVSAARQGICMLIGELPTSFRVCNNGCSSNVYYYRICRILLLAGDTLGGLCRVSINKAIGERYGTNKLGNSVNT